MEKRRALSTVGTCSFLQHEVVGSSHVSMMMMEQGFNDDDDDVP